MAASCETRDETSLASPSLLLAKLLIRDLALDPVAEVLNCDESEEVVSP